MTYPGFHSNLATQNSKEFLVPFYSAVEKIRKEDVPKWINSSVTLHKDQKEGYRKRVRC
jgi:hypothetical protein